MPLTSATAIRALQNELIELLSLARPDIVADIVLKDDEWTEVSRIGRCCAVLEVEDDSHSLLSSGARPRRQLVVRGACEANGSNDALTGTENPIPSDVELLGALQTIIEMDRTQLGTSPLLLPEIRVGRRRDGDKESGDLRVNEFRFTCIYLPNE